jgi:hypothetical protein
LPGHVGDFVRIANRGRHAVAQDAPVEFERRPRRDRKCARPSARCRLQRAPGPAR